MDGLPHTIEEVINRTSVQSHSTDQWGKSLINLRNNNILFWTAFYIFLYVLQILIRIRILALNLKFVIYTSLLNLFIIYQPLPPPKKKRNHFRGDGGLSRTYLTVNALVPCYIFHTFFLR